MIMLCERGRNTWKGSRAALLVSLVCLGISCGVGYDVTERVTPGSGGGLPHAGSAGFFGDSNGSSSSFTSGGSVSNSTAFTTSGAGGAGDPSSSAMTGGSDALSGQAGVSNTSRAVPQAGASGGAAASTPNPVGGGSAGAHFVTSISACGMEIDNTGSRLKRKMLLRDEGRNRLALIDVESAPNSWYIDLERQGHDFQLIGDCRVMVGTDAGYAVYDLRPPHEKVEEVTSFPGTVAARRLRTGNTLLVGVGQGSSPYQGSDGVVLIEIDGSGNVANKIVVPGTYYTRLVRETPSGTYLVANNTRVIEVDRAGNVLSPSLTVSTQASTHTWKALRISSSPPGASETIVSTGNLASLVFFDSAGNMTRRITGGTASIVNAATAVNPQFFSDFQILGNGNLIVANSYEGGGEFTDCISILEYTPDGALAWYWGDPAYREELSAIRGIIVLDGLDPSKLHVEDANGRQVPVN